MITVRIRKEGLDIALARRNLTQAKLAANIHTAPHYLSQLVTRRRSVAPAMRQRLLDYLKPCKFDDLFVIEDDQRANPE